MKAKLYISFLLPLLIAGLLAGCSSSSKDKGAQLEALKAEQAKLSQQITDLEAEVVAQNPGAAIIKAKEVVVTKLEPSTFEHFIQTQGRVEAENDVNVSAKSMGVVTKVFVTEGQNVVAGQTLVQIDNGIIIKGIEEVKSQLELAKTVFQRQKNLWDQKIGTEIQYLQAKTNKESLENRLASLNEQNDMSRIKSPINGFVDEVYAKAGQNIAPGMPAVHVVNFSDLKITANISEAYATLVEKGNKAIVMIPELKKDIVAQVTFVSKTINPLSRTFTVEVNVPALPNLRPNMSGVVRVVYLTHKNAVAVPINIVQTVNDQKVVYVAEKDGQNMIARKRVVTISDVFNSMTQVISGVTAGEQVITFGYQGLNDGEIIKM